MSNGNVTVRQLRAFVLVAECGSFTQAAARLGITQSGLSILIKELESELELRLFDRHPRLVEMTPAGRDFLAPARRTLNCLDDAVDSMRELRKVQRGRVRVGAPQMLAFAHLPFITSRFLAQFPAVDVSMIDGTLGQTLAQVVTGDLDIVIGPDTEVPDGVQSELLANSEAVLVCCRDHPLARRRTVKWRELAGEHFISATPDVLAAVQNLVRSRTRKGPQFRSVQTVDYMTTAVGMARAGLGVTMCPAFAAPFLLGADVAMLRLADPPFVRNVYIYTSQRRTPTPAMKAFIDCIAQHVW